MKAPVRSTVRPMPSRQWKKHGPRVAPSSPLALLLAPVVAKAVQLGRIQSQCMAKRLSWAAYYTELGNLRMLKERCEVEIKEMFK